MAAIITDQLRIVNASNFVSGVQSSANSYYAFIGLPNAGSYASTWDSDPPAPKDAFSQSDDCLLYTSPSPRDSCASRMPSSA